MEELINAGIEEAMCASELLEAIREDAVIAKNMKDYWRSQASGAD